MTNEIKHCNDCPLGGDIENDCADCIYSCDYHFVNGECVKRKELNKMKTTNCTNTSEIPFGSTEIKNKIDAIFLLSHEVLQLVGDYGEYHDDENEVIDEVANFVNAYKNAFGDSILTFANKQPSPYKWQSVRMGNLAENFWQVLREIWVDLTKFHVLNIKWKYNRNGF